MTPEAQRIAIAEACPKLFVLHDGEPFGRPHLHWRLGNGEASSDTVDPLSDLNAMHQAIGTLLSDASWDRYRKYLRQVCNTEGQPESTAWFLENNATAAQRAEVLLRTIGKWTD